MLSRGSDKDKECVGKVLWHDQNNIFWKNRSMLTATLVHLGMDYLLSWSVVQKVLQKALC